VGAAEKEGGEGGEGVGWHVDGVHGVEFGGIPMVFCGHL